MCIRDSYKSWPATKFHYVLDEILHCSARSYRLKNASLMSAVDIAGGDTKRANVKARMAHSTLNSGAHAVIRGGDSWLNSAAEGWYGTRGATSLTSH